MYCLKVTIKFKKQNKNNQIKLPRMHVSMCYLCIKKSIVLNQVHVVHGPGAPAIKGLQLWPMKGF